MVGFTSLLNVFLHFEEYLSAIIAQFGIFTYLMLFLVIFLETGIIIIPFLPGDSLLFAAGTFAAIGSLNVFLLFLVLSLAAILGDTLNYWIGYLIGEKASKLETRLIKKHYLDRTQKFYERHGGKTIVLARFIPVIRTFAPFIAGVGKMRYKKFLVYNVSGGILWVGLFVFLGYWFGNIPFIRNHFAFVIIAVIAISLIPLIIEIIISQKREK